MTNHIKQFLHTGSLATIVGLVMASHSLAQAPAASSPPQFRDPTTGQVWTPQNVGGSSGPNTAADRAFNPQSQTAAVPGVVVQTPTVAVLGTVPITAGPNVPIAIIDNSSLSVIPGQGWQVVLYLNNNSAGPINPIIDCRFTNAGNLVQTTRANLPPVGAGQRVGLTIGGPPSSLFVDRAECQLASPT